MGYKFEFNFKRKISYLENINTQKSEDLTLEEHEFLKNLKHKQINKISNPFPLVLLIGRNSVRNVDRPITNTIFQNLISLKFLSMD